MNNEKLNVVEGVVERYLNSKNEDFFNDFKSIVSFLTENGVTNGVLVDKVVKHYWFKVNENGGDFKTYAPSQDVKMVMSSIDILKQWVQEIDEEHRSELFQLFNTMYNNASIIDKVSMWNQREKHKVLFAQAMKLRGEKIKKEDFAIPTDDEGSTKPFSEILSKINSMGEAMVKNVYVQLSIMTALDELNDDIYQFIDSYTIQCMDLIKSAHNIQCEKQQVKMNYIIAMVEASNKYLNNAYDNIEIFVKSFNNNKQSQEQVTSANIEVIDGIEFMNDFK